MTWNDSPTAGPNTARELAQFTKALVELEFEPIDDPDLLQLARSELEEIREYQSDFVCKVEALLWRRGLLAVTARIVR